MEEHCLLVCSQTMLRYLSYNNQKVSSSMGDWASHINQHFRKCHTDLLKANLIDITFTEIPSSQVALVCAKLTQKANQHTCHEITQSHDSGQGPLATQKINILALRVSWERFRSVGMSKLVGKDTKYTDSRECVLMQRAFKVSQDQNHSGALRGCTKDSSLAPRSSQVAHSQKKTKKKLCFFLLQQKYSAPNSTLSLK